MSIKWFVGSNGNQFADFEDSRFCIFSDDRYARVTDCAWAVSRNGDDISLSKGPMTHAEARQFIVDQCHIDADRK